jgi:glycine cleavage system H protein
MVSMAITSKHYPMIPEKEQRCLWMATGFISYKLCDRNFQCDLCPFDQALKNTEGSGDERQEFEADLSERSSQDETPVGISGAIFYHPDHCWVKVENPEQARIGIDDLVTQLMSDLRVAILPKIGSAIRQGECCAHIIQSDYIFPVISPLSGSVRSVNPQLKKKPELIIDDPRGEGWLITIKPKNLECDLKNLLFGREALQWYQSKEREIIAKSDSMLKHQMEAVGPTMQDGGVRISRLQDILNTVSSTQKARILDSSIKEPVGSKRAASSHLQTRFPSPKK